MRELRQVFGGLRLISEQVPDLRILAAALRHGGDRLGIGAGCWIRFHIGKKHRFHSDKRLCFCRSGDNSRKGLAGQGSYNAGRELMSAPAQLRGHARIDARSLAMHRAIAEKLRATPELLEIAHDNIRRWSATAGRSQPYLAAWEQLLGKPLEELLELLVQDTEPMRAMRQAAPFAGVLTPKERWAIYDAFATGASDPGSGNDCW
jgi:hypothetical protein